GEVYCFLFDGISYFFVIGALIAMRVPAREKARGAKENVMHGLRQGLRYAFGFAPIRAILLLISVMALMGMPHNILMPIMAKDVLAGDAKTLGLLNGCSGIGALAGAIYLASRRTVLGLGRHIANAAIIFSLALIAFALSKSLWAS